MTKPDADHDTRAEIMSVLRKMFGNDIPEMESILIPRWGKDPFFRGTYSNWPIGVSTKDFDELKVFDRNYNKYYSLVYTFKM